MKRHPAGAGCDDDPGGRFRAAAGGRRLGALSSPLSSAAARIVVSAHSGRPYTLYSAGRTGESAGLVGCGSTTEIAERATECTVPSTECTDSSHSAAGLPRTAELGTEAAEILISASGGGPAASGEAAATEGPEGPRREAGRSRGGRGAESAGWREVAAWCHAEEGVGHE